MKRITFSLICAYWCCVTGIILLLLAAPVHAATLTVTNANDSGAGSLRQAITNATAGDTIIFDPALTGGTIPLTSGQLAINTRVTIQGLGASVLTVRGNNASRVFEIGTSGIVTITGLTIADGYVSNLRGGGISNAGTLTLDDCVITRNRIGGLLLGIRRYGGNGIYNSGTLTITRSTISDNTHQNNAAGGGGIFNDGILYLRDSTVRGNQTRSTRVYGIYGGGGIANRGAATIIASTIISNTANDFTSGGGAGIYNDGTMTITSSALRNNVATGNFGGGILNWQNGALTIRTSTLAGNTTDRGGGGIENTGTLTVIQSTLSGNLANGAYDGGGGIGNTVGTLRVENSTLSNNQGVLYGGGIFNDEGSATITFSTLSNNTASLLGGGIYITGYVTNTLTTLTNSIIANNTNQDCVNAGGILANINAWIEDNTCSPNFFGDPVLSPLQRNGGETETHALLPGSPAIDQIPANAHGCGTTFMVDQVGTMRPIGGRCDLGAFEYVRPTAVTLTRFDASADARVTWFYFGALGLITLALSAGIVWRVRAR
ncbi:MAG: hypothetical protein HZC40_05935 [Chloroflexi bacterium]|nr:hypothetical protein [Chloroflexota bacterium]